MADRFGAIRIVETDADEDDSVRGWVVQFDTNLDDDELDMHVELDGIHPTPGAALDAAIRWAKARALSLTPATASVVRRLT